MEALKEQTELIQRQFELLSHMPGSSGFEDHFFLKNDLLIYYIAYTTLLE